MERVRCPTCDRLKPAFAIVNGRCREDERDEARVSVRPEMTWDDIRGQRSILLQRCDWTQVADADLTQQERDAWASYRQLLRDIPETYPSPQAVVWPTPPG